jgi:hypothetical protein
MSVVEQKYRPCTHCNRPTNIHWPEDHCWLCLQQVDGMTRTQADEVGVRFEEARGPLIIMNPYPPLLLPPI